MARVRLRASSLQHGDAATWRRETWRHRQVTAGAIRVPPPLPRADGRPSAIILRRIPAAAVSRRCVSHKPATATAAGRRCGCHSCICCWYSGVVRYLEWGARYQVLIGGPWSYRSGTEGGSWTCDDFAATATAAAAAADAAADAGLRLMSGRRAGQIDRLRARTHACQRPHGRRTQVSTHDMRYPRACMPDCTSTNDARNQRTIS